MKIVFRKEFEDKLNGLGIRDKFVANLREALDRDNETDEEKQDDLSYILSNKIWKRFVSSAFIWEDTQEGHDYWENIAKS